MIVGATVLAALMLLLLLAERGSSFVWRGGPGKATYYCTLCDLRYPLGYPDERRARICPRGHIVEPLQQGFEFSSLFMTVCIAFIVVGGLLIASGRASGP